MKWILHKNHLERNVEKLIHKMKLVVMQPKIKHKPEIQRVSKVNKPYRISPHQILEGWAGYVIMTTIILNAISFFNSKAWDIHAYS